MRRAVFHILLLLGSLASLSAAAMADGYADAKAGIAAMQSGNADRAIRQFTRALDSGQLSAGQRGSILSRRGNAWLDEGRFDKAIADYGMAIRLIPQKINGHINKRYEDVLGKRARAWQGKGEYDMGTADYNDLIRLNPDNAMALYDRGVMRFYQGHFKASAGDFDRTWRLNPGDPFLAIWMYLARARQMNGDARARLAANTEGLGPDQWPAPIVAMFMDKSDATTVASRAMASRPDVQKKRICESDFYGGEWYVLKRESKQARMLFQQARNQCPRHLDEYTGALVELGRLYSSQT